MDLRALMEVLLRHRAIIVGGVIAAVVLATLSYYKPVMDGGGLPRLEPRKEELWQASEVLFLTQPGFPAGRTEQPFVTRRIGNQQTTVTRFADPGKFTSLAPLYAQLANSDAVKARATRSGGPLPGKAKTIPTADTSYGAVNILPMITVFGTAPTIDAAVSTAARVSAAFRGYLRSSQEAAKIPDDKRVAIQVVNKAGSESLLLVPRKKTLPIVVLLAVLSATVALVFARDNTKRTRAPAVVVPDTRAPAAAAVAATAAAAEQRTAAVEHPRFRPERQRAPGPRLGS